jgi:OmpA-OmpF porin, OOP family
MKNCTRFCCLIIAIFIAVTTLKAQINPLEKVKDKTTNRVDNKVDNGIDKGLDKVEGVFNKKDKNKKTSEDTTTTNNNSGNDSNTSGSENTNTTTKNTPVLTSYSKFDFIPGSDVLFYEDFSQTAIGDFPSAWNTNGSGEVMTTNLFTGKWLKLTSDRTCIFNDVPLNLPENYTVEFDVIPQKTDNGATSYYFGIISSDKPNEFDYGSTPGKAGFFVQFSYNTYFNSYYSDERAPLTGMKEGVEQKADQKYHISIWVQKSRVRVYQDEVKLFDLPKGVDLGVKYNKIRFEDGVPLINNIRVAVGAPDMRSKLLTDGKIVSYGIYFDSGKDVVKGESYGSLKEIAAVLTENPTVKIKIVGFTDSDGDDAANLELSKKRAIAVKTALNKDFSIDNSRMETDGKGETEPIAPNTTSEGKAKNRRVEFIKL